MYDARNHSHALLLKIKPFHMDDFISSRSRVTVLAGSKSRRWHSHRSWVHCYHTHTHTLPTKITNRYCTKWNKEIEWEWKRERERLTAHHIIIHKRQGMKKLDACCAVARSIQKRYDYINVLLCQRDFPSKQMYYYSCALAVPLLPQIGSCFICARVSPNDVSQNQNKTAKKKFPIFSCKNRATLSERRTTKTKHNSEWMSSSCIHFQTRL